MPTIRKQWPSTQYLFDMSSRHVILIPLLLFIIAVIFKILDVFVWRLDEVLGEIIVSKSIGFLIVVLYLWAVSKSITAIGLHGKSIGKTLIIGVTGVVLILFVSYGVQFGVLAGGDKEPSFVITAIDPKAGVTGGLSFALFLTVGNFINSFMEEGLFRGVMLRHFRASMSFWRANFLQAALFAVWHLNWPIKQFITGETDIGGMVSGSIIMLVATGVCGFSLGYLYLKTDNLWGPWIMHTINNSVQNLVHIQAIDGLDSGIIWFQVTLTFCLVAVIPLFRYLAKQFQTSEVSPWGGDTG